MHLIAHPDDYLYPASPSRLTVKAQRPRSEPLQAEPSLADDFAGLTPERAAERLIRRLDLHYRKLLKASDYDSLRFQVQSGQQSPAELLKAGIAAAAAGRREQFVAELRQGAPD
ncbi:hypothetical protein [Deinococcus arcticus]|uniref:hypothetical protein n=1 Tax=Deinococcus arcticus TaxID=2136176 RepID=UPI001E3E27BA|nr:hypothetical protein [Deinococcus arcticus]